MKLLRRKPPEPNAAQKALSVVKLAARGLAVQRIARNAFGAYKFARRLPMLIGGAVVAVFALKKLRGSGNDAGPETWTAPPSTPPAPIQTAPAAATPTPPPAPETPAATTPGSAAAAEKPAEPATTPDDESPVETAATGTPPVDPETDLPPAADVDGAADPDITIAAAATDAGTTGGGSDAVAGDPSDAIGADLVAAAEGGSGDDKIPTPGQEDLRAPAPDETS